MQLRNQPWKVTLLLLQSVILIAQAENPFSRHDPLNLRSATPNQTTISQYSPLELTLDLSATFDNPFNPDDIDVHALFTSPKGKKVQVNGFLFQPFTRRLENNSEKIESAGEPVWKIRFTPDLSGTWSYQVSAKDRTGSATLRKAKFKVTKSSHPGFIRRSSTNPQAFAWDNGKSYFPVGQNVCWGGGRGSFDYDDWLPPLSRAGGNFIRIWMCSWNCALEWAETGKGELRNGKYHGIGVYSLDNAWKLDTILDIAERNGISVMLCLGTYGEFNDGGYFNEGQWKANPYNVTNGGPCLKPEDFWTHSTARKLYQQRLRYLAARYGHRTNIQAWEFWNEAKAPAPWVAEMARCFKGTGEFQGCPADPYTHLVTTTYGTDEVWRIPEIDYTQTHSYGTGNIVDHAPVMIDEARKHAKYGKPHLMGEFGIDWRSPDSKYDADGKGVNLHNALWASIMSGDGGTAMIWWWDNYIHPKKLYPHYTPIRRFVDTVPWTQGEWKTLKAEAVVPADKSAGAPAPGLHVYGLMNSRMAIAWIQNPKHQWKNVYEKNEIPPVRDAEVVLRDLPPGAYKVEWFDTWKGEVLRQEEARCVNSELRLKLPELSTDVAIRLLPGK